MLFTPDQQEHVLTRNLGIAGHAEQVGGNRAPASRPPSRARPEGSGCPDEARATVGIGPVHLLGRPGRPEHRQEGQDDEQRTLKADRRDHETERRRQAVGGCGRGHADCRAGEEADRIALQPLGDDDAFARVGCVAAGAAGGHLLLALHGRQFTEKASRIARATVSSVGLPDPTGCKLPVLIGAPRAGHRSRQHMRGAQGLCAGPERRFADPSGARHTLARRERVAAAITPTPGGPQSTDGHRCGWSRRVAGHRGHFALGPTSSAPGDPALRPRRRSRA